MNTNTMNNKINGLSRYTLYKLCSVTMCFSLLGFLVFSSVEPVVVNAVTDDVTVTLTVDGAISISAGADVTMSPNLGVSADESVGSTSWTVITNDTDGYTLSVKAAASPALSSAGDDFPDYTEGTPGTPDTWAVDSGLYEFGFSAFGTDAELEYTDASTDGSPESSCPSTGTLGSTDHGFEGFTTSNETIASNSATTTTSGTATTLCLAAAQNGALAPAGTYTGTVTATALTN